MMAGRNERDQSAVQSLSRGLTVLRLLARRGEATATEIAAELGLHQSSASRMLRSLEREGFVCKPSFRRFALDYGVLVFAGATMEGFPEVAASVSACNRLNAKTGWNAAAAILREDRLVYLARISGAGNAADFVSASDFPIHRSSLGLVLLHRQRGRRMIPALARSMARHGPDEAGRSPEALYEFVHAEIERRGVLALERYGANAFNVAGLFQTRRGMASLALFGPDPKVRIDDVVGVLKEALRDLEARLATKPKAVRKE